MTPHRSNWPAANLNQTAVWWTSSGMDGFGKRTWNSGTEISARWEDTAQTFLDPQGRETVSRSVVYVASAVALGDFLYLGDLDDLDSTEEGDPTVVATAYEVKNRGNSTSLVDSTRTLTKVILA